MAGYVFGITWTKASGTARLLQRGPLLRALQKHRGVKASYLILNDPSGCKSRKGLTAKKEVGI